MLHFTVRDNITDALARQIGAAAAQAEHIVAVQVAKDTEPFVPARNKSLVNRTQVLGNTILYPGPYAQYLYHGMLMVDPDTGSAWARKGAVKVVTGKELTISTAVNPQAQARWFAASKLQNIETWTQVAEKVVTNALNNR